MNKDLKLLTRFYNLKLLHQNQEILKMINTVPINEKEALKHAFINRLPANYFQEKMNAFYQLEDDKKAAIADFNQKYQIEQSTLATLKKQIKHLFLQNQKEIKQFYKKILIDSNVANKKEEKQKMKKLLGLNYHHYHLDLWDKKIYFFARLVYHTFYNIRSDEELQLPPDLKSNVAQLLNEVNKYNDIVRQRIKWRRQISNEINFHYFSDKLVQKNGKEVLLSLKDVEISFGAGSSRFVAVSNVSFDIYKGETFGLVGESGSGKTTIGRAIVRINPVYSGKIEYRGLDISKKMSGSKLAEMRKRIQMIYQDPAASLNERATVDYIVSEGLRAFKLYDNDVERREKIEEAMRSVGLLPEHLRRYPHEFSGGQRQRIGIARSIVMRPEFIIADEPISALDVSIRAQVLNLLKSFQKELDLTYLFIAHDLSVVRHIADRIAVISRGNIVELAPAELLFEHPIHDYTLSLLSAIPQPDPELEKNKKLIEYQPRYYREDEQVMFFEIEKDHFVLGTMDEIKKYKIRLQQFNKISKHQK